MSQSQQKAQAQVTTETSLSHVFFEKKPRFGVWGLGWFRVSGFQNHSASLNPGYHPILGVDTLRAVGRYKHEDERCKDEAF